MTSSFLPLFHPLDFMPDPLADAKTALRHRMRARLREVPEAVCATWSEALCAQLMGGILEDWKGSTVALFGGMAGEADLRSLVPWLESQGGSAVFFDFAEGHLQPRHVRHLAQLKRGTFGVWIPDDSCPVLPVSELQLILTPGLAFDEQGGRLGRGGGYFDRLFGMPATTAQRLGICFECQLVPQVPMEGHDARVQALLTEKGPVTLKPVFGD